MPQHHQQSGALITVAAQVSGRRTSAQLRKPSRQEQKVVSLRALAEQRSKSATHLKVLLQLGRGRPQRAAEHPICAWRVPGSDVRSEHEVETLMLRAPKYCTA